MWFSTLKRQTFSSTSGSFVPELCVVVDGGSGLVSPSQSVSTAAAGRLSLQRSIPSHWCWGERKKKKRWPLSLVTRSGIGISVCHWGELTWLKHAAENIQVGSKKGVKKKQPVQSERCTHYKLFTCIFKKTFKPVLTRRLPTWTHAQIYLSITLHAEYFKYLNTLLLLVKKYVANLMCVIFGTMRVFSAIQWPHSVTTPLLV